MLHLEKEIFNRMVFDLWSGEQYYVCVLFDKMTCLVIDRITGDINTMSYDEAMINAKNQNKLGTFYGIVGKYLKRYLVLIKSISPVGTICDPNTKLEHIIYVITEVKVIDIHSPPPPPPPPAALPTRSSINQQNQLSTDSETSFNTTSNTIRHDFDECREADFSSLPITISSSSYNSGHSRAWNPFKIANSIKTRMPSQILRSTGLDSMIMRHQSSSTPDESDNNIIQRNLQNSEIPNNTQSSGNSAASSGSSDYNHQYQQIDEADKRLIDEMVKLFNNTNSFYFSPSLDLTRRFSQASSFSPHGTQWGCLWRSADERFFWNNYMLTDFLELAESKRNVNKFIAVILQGFISIEYHHVNENKINLSLNESDKLRDVELIKKYGGIWPLKDRIDIAPEELDYTSKTQVCRFALVSRRSVFQAGTRYRRRGCDDEGNVANFVETEQIFIFNKHFLSIVILRGSIPLFWYQTGFNYRPPPVLFKNENENFEAFWLHFKNLIEKYNTKRIIGIDCTEQTGREKSLHDAYKSSMDKLISGQGQFDCLKLIQFDFHKHCRGRQCSDSQVEKHLKSCGLTDQLLNDVKYYWNDGDIVCEQSGVMRVNCLDCTDRTNVVQRAIALQMLDLQLSRLGLMSPDINPEDNDFRKIMRNLWSTNGNVLSTQYCGTRALFTGDKKISGYLKDTYSSASRYYISKFRDAYRQAAIDAMLGVVNSGPIDHNQYQQQQQHNNRKNITVNVPSNNNDMLNFDPVYIGKSGSALLKYVGNRMSNRLARLKGSLYDRPQYNMDSMRMSTVEAATAAHEAVSVFGTEVKGVDDVDPISIENRMVHTLDSLNIDWPSNESITSGANVTNRVLNTVRRSGSGPICSQRIGSDDEDEFQDDEFGQLMLSIDLAELQKIRDQEEQVQKRRNSIGNSLSHQFKQQVIEEGGENKEARERSNSKSATTTPVATTTIEEFDMAESCIVGAGTRGSSSNVTAKRESVNETTLTKPC